MPQYIKLGEENRAWNGLRDSISNAGSIPATSTMNKQLYIWVLDFGDGTVNRHDISKESWDPDTESCEDYLVDYGYSLGNIEYMVTESADFNAD